MLTGQAKKDYQRKYMRLRRLKAKLGGGVVRPSTSKAVRPQLDADGNRIYED